MSTSTEPSAVRRRRPLFPLARQLSAALTPLLLRTPLTPNHITTLSLLVGLASAAAFAVGGTRASLWGALAFALSYALDNSDGEVARAKGLTSRFGALYDSVVDAIVNTIFFAALGIGVTRTTGEPVWAWLGYAATLGGVINSVLSLPREARAIWSRETEPATDEEALTGSATLKEHLFFAARALSRTDFWFIVLVLALLDMTWLLLPAGAIGAQVYWISGLSQKAEDIHV